MRTVSAFAILILILASIMVLNRRELTPSEIDGSPIVVEPGPNQSDTDLHIER